MKKALTALLCALFMLPALLSPFGADIENRRADARTDDFFANPAAYLTERLALRTLLLTARGRLLALLGESGSERVILGKNGFLYYQDTLPDYLKTRDPAEIGGLADKLSALSDALASEGRTLYVLIAPNKSTVYPEYMPGRFLRGAADSCLTLLLNALAARDVRYVDAEAALITNKAAGQLYFSGDTHWNARGAYFVFKALTEALGETGGEIPAFSEGRAGDMLVLCQPGASPAETDGAPVLRREYRFVRPMRTENDMRIETEGPGKTNLLLVRDSFGAGLLPYLANAAGRLTLSRVYEGIPAQARAAQASVVVLEIAERDLLSLHQIELIGSSAE